MSGGAGDVANFDCNFATRALTSASPSCCALFAASASVPTRRARAVASGSRDSSRLANNACARTTRGGDAMRRPSASASSKCRAATSGTTREAGELALHDRPRSERLTAADAPRPRRGARCGRRSSTRAHDRAARSRASPARRVRPGHHAALGGRRAERQERGVLDAGRRDVAGENATQGTQRLEPGAQWVHVDERLELWRHLDELALEDVRHDPLTGVHADGIGELRALPDARGPLRPLGRLREPPLHRRAERRQHLGEPARLGDTRRRRRRRELRRPRARTFPPRPGRRAACTAGSGPPPHTRARRSLRLRQSPRVRTRAPRLGSPGASSMTPRRSGRAAPARGHPARARAAGRRGSLVAERKDAVSCSTALAAIRSTASRVWTRDRSSSSSAVAARHASSSAARMGGSVMPHSGIGPA